jgi:hypothetical protein
MANEHENESPGFLQEPEKMEVPEGVQGLISEFFVQLVSRLIPGSIFSLLYLKESLHVKISAVTGFLGITTLLCIAWICGTALDKASYGVFMWYLKRRANLRKEREQRDQGVERKGLTKLDPYHPHINKQSPAAQRQSLISVCDKIMFRSLGVVAFFVSIKAPTHWPFSFQYGSPIWPNILPPVFCWGRFLGIAGVVTCVICWLALQSILTEAEDNDKKRKKAEAKHSRS